MTARVTFALLLLVTTSCERTVAANSPESLPPTPPWLVVGIEPLSNLNAHYEGGIPGDPVQYPIDTRRQFRIFELTLREQQAPDGGSIEGRRTAIMRFLAQDVESGITALAGELIFDFSCHRPLDDGTGHYSIIPGQVTLTRSFTADDPERLPLEKQIDFEFSGNLLWREGGCGYSSGSAPYRRGSIQNVHVSYAGWASNGSVMRAALPASISGDFRIVAPIRIDLDR
jgi:hypothetical protein